MNQAEPALVYDQANMTAGTIDVFLEINTNIQWKLISYKFITKET